VGSICFLANVAAGHGALDLGIGDGLLALETGLRAMHLGYSNIGDYAREELGLNASTAVKKARLARRSANGRSCARPSGKARSRRGRPRWSG
jgi:hypothetical protein